LGDNVGMFSTSSVNVSGKTGGGTILIGGDYQGKNADIQNATKTFVHQDAQLIADATDSGDGGKVIVWGNDITRYYGSVSAKGGVVSGNGGFVEISGKRLLNFLGNVDLSAANGRGGNLLLDPTNITIGVGTDANTIGFSAVDNEEAFAEDLNQDSFFDVTALTGSFAGITEGSTITLQATNDITVKDAFNVATATGSANNNLVLEANNDIHVKAAIALDGTGALTLKADADDNGAGNVAIGANITTQRGGLTLEGYDITHTAGNIATTGATNTNAGNITITASNAVLLGGALITADGGTTSSVGRAGGIVNITANAGVETGAISANASHAAVSDADGGNAGFITINNLVSGDIKVNGSLFARTGTSTGTVIGVGGNFGEVKIINQANGGNVTTGAIDLRAKNKAHGGNVVISSKADVTVNGYIDTSINVPVPTNDVAGRNAGNITITGVNRTINGAITANGGAGGASNQAGGNAGVISITGAGALTTGTITAKTGNANGTGTGGAAGSVTLSGSQVTSAAIDTSHGTNGTGGNVNITTIGGGTSTVTSINADNSGAININNMDTLTVSGVIAGDNATVTKSGAGSLIYAGTNTYTGGTVVNAGVLQIGNGATNGSIVGNITNNATVVFNRSDAYSYADSISGSGAVEKVGSGELTFSGNNTYIGATNIKADTLKLGNAGAIGDLSAMNISSGATFDLNGYAETVGSIAGAGNIVMGTAALTSGGNNASTTFSGVISGTAGNFNKAGSGTLTLSGNNTYTGVTNVQGGTLTAAHANALGATAGGTNVASGATLNVNNVTLAAEAITLANAAALTGTDAAIVTGNVSAGDNSQIGTTSAASTLTINGILTSATNSTLEIIGAGSVIATNTDNDIDIVKITNAKDVSLRDINSIRFANAASNLTGTLTVNAIDNITLQTGGTMTSSAGDILLTSNAFINNAGANALTATAGRWVVHTDALAGNIYGGLNSGNQAIYGRSLGVATAEAGNRYVFVQSPTLDITSTDQTKTYGQDAATLVANAYIATPFVNAATYGNVFTQDTVANSLTGSATSTGSAVASNVGSYAIDVTPVAATTGYTLNKSNAGNLTVTAAILPVSPVNTSGNISVFNNAVTRSDQELACSQFNGNQPIVNGLDAFGADNVDYEPSISQPLVGGVVANALAATTCLKL